MKTECMMVKPRMNSVYTQIIRPMPGLLNMATEFLAIKATSRPHEEEEEVVVASISRDSGSL